MENSTELPGKKIELHVVVIDDDPGDMELLRRFLAGIDDWQINLQAFQSLEHLNRDGHDALETAALLFIDYLLGADTGLEIFTTFTW